MGWFRSAPGPSPPVSRPGPLDPGASRVSAGTRIVGRLEGATEVVIDGELQGEARLDGALLVGATGRVTGSIYARFVRVAGQVVGDVHGIERVELLAGGSVEGDLAAPRVIVGEGAFLSGKVAMHETLSKGAARPAVAGGRASASGSSDSQAPEKLPAGAAASAASRDAKAASLANSADETPRNPEGTAAAGGESTGRKGVKEKEGHDRDAMAGSSGIVPGS